MGFLDPPSQAFGRWRGTYDPMATYLPGDVVEKDGSCYIVKPSGGVLGAPPDITSNTITVEGPQGPQGMDGPPGQIGGGPIAINYVFDTNTTDADAGSGYMRFDNVTQNLTTTIRVSEHDKNGIDWSLVLDTFDDSTNPIKGHIRVTGAADLTKWILFEVHAIADAGTYRNVAVACIASSSASPFLIGNELMIMFARVGDAGIGSAVGAELSYAEVTANVATTSTSPVDITGLSVTTTTAGIIEVILTACFKNSIANNGAVVYILEDGVIIDTSTPVHSLANTKTRLTMITRRNPTHGSHTYKAQFQAFLTGTATLEASTLQPGSISVKSRN